MTGEVEPPGGAARLQRMQAHRRDGAPHPDDKLTVELLHLGAQDVEALQPEQGLPA